jgi:hypothetical protein
VVSRLSAREEDHGTESGLWRGKLIPAVLLSSPVLLLAFSGSSFGVLLIYVAVSLEGIGIAYLLISKRQVLSGSGGADEPEAPIGVRSRGTADKVEALGSYVKWAGQGSDFSRRDIARTIAQALSVIYGKQYAGDIVDNPKFLEALRVVVLPYVNDPGVKEALFSVERMRPDLVKHKLSERESSGQEGNYGRGRYLSSLEVLVVDIEKDMEGWGRA